MHASQTVDDVHILEAISKGTQGDTGNWSWSIMHNSINLYKSCVSDTTSLDSYYIQGWNNSFYSGNLPSAHKYLDQVLTVICCWDLLTTIGLI